MCVARLRLVGWTDIRPVGGGAAAGSARVKSSLTCCLQRESLTCGETFGKVISTLSGFLRPNAFSGVKLVLPNSSGGSFVLAQFTCSGERPSWDENHQSRN